ncbi:MAG: hypothetical protein EOM91_20185 [Sphingobacteriia bacterium]|nr:hypothetical protein [Sphingobacteriia bacterium]
MNSYTFEMWAAVTVAAESEDEARERLRTSAAGQEEDVDYNGVDVYLSTPEAMQAKLVDTVGLDRPPA